MACFALATFREVPHSCEVTGDHTGLPVFAPTLPYQALSPALKTGPCRPPVASHLSSTKKACPAARLTEKREKGRDPEGLGAKPRPRRRWKQNETWTIRHLQICCVTNGGEQNFGPCDKIRGPVVPGIADVNACPDPFPIRNQLSRVSRQD